MGIGASFSSELYPTRMRASATGWATGMGRLGGVVAPVIAGWVIQGGGSMPIVFSILGAVPILSALTQWGMKLETTGRSLEEISNH